MDIVKVFFDLETTGLDAYRNAIHQLSGMIEVNGIIDREFDFRLCPPDDLEVVPEALAVSETTMEDLESFPAYPIVYRQFLEMLGDYCNRFDRKDKMWLVGFNNRKFDDIFLRAFFEYNKDRFFGSWFWPDSLDVMILASQYLIDRRSSMPSFKLHRVALELGLEVDNSKLHDGVYDVKLTREIYRIVTGLEIEL